MAPLRYKHYGQVCTPLSRSRLRRRRSPSRRRYEARQPERSHADGGPHLRVQRGGMEAQTDRSIGQLGRILYIDTARLSLGRYQNDCNVIWDLAPHDISIISYLLDEFPETVSAWAQRNVGDVHANIACQLGLPEVIGARLRPCRSAQGAEGRRSRDCGQTEVVVCERPPPTTNASASTTSGCCPRRSPRGRHIRCLSRIGPVTSSPGYSSSSCSCRTSTSSTARDPAARCTPGEKGLGVVRVLAATDAASVVGVPVHTQLPAEEPMAIGTPKSSPHRRGPRTRCRSWILPRCKRSPPARIRDRVEDGAPAPMLCRGT